MTATYKLEAIDDGKWTTVHESTDPFSIIQPTIDLSAKQRSMRTTVIYGDDKLAKVIGNVREHDSLADKSGPPWMRAEREAAADDVEPRPQMPTVGRIVLYRRKSSSSPVPAIVTQVGLLQNGSRVPDVKLHIFWPDTVEEIASESGFYRFTDQFEVGCWSWPPRA